MNSLERAQKRKIAVFGKKKCTLLKESLLQFLCVKAISEKVISSHCSHCVSIILAIVVTCERVLIQLTLLATSRRNCDVSYDETLFESILSGSSDSAFNQSKNQLSTTDALHSLR